MTALPLSVLLQQQRESAAVPARLEVPDRVLALDVDLTPIMHRLTELDAQRLALVVRQWFAAHPEWIDPFKMMVCSQGSGTYLAIDEAYELSEEAHAAPGASGEEFSPMSASEDLIDCMSDNLSGYNAGVFRDLVDALNEHEWTPARVDADLAAFVERRGKVSAPEFFAAAFVSSAPPPETVPASLPAALRAPDEINLRKTREHMERMYSQKLSLQVREWFAARPEAGLAFKMAGSVELEALPISGPEATRQIPPGSPVERDIATTLAPLFNQLDRVDYGRFRCYGNFLVNTLNAVAWDSDFVDRAIANSITIMLDVDGAAWLASVDALAHQKHLEVAVTPAPAEPRSRM